ncbi:MAG TPA: putative glycolipid-binding domain-containing protein [Ardenticatenaceae bacterium]|jgi:hypothetical protein
MSVIPASILEPVEIVYGVYTLRGDHAGDDRWWIQRMVESDTGWMVHNDIYLDMPRQRYVTLDAELSEEWDWLYFNLRDEAGNILSAEVDQDKLVVELNGAVMEFPFGPQSELDYLSPFMNSLTLRRLLLQPGQSVTRNTVWFDPDTFVPRLVQQTYTRGDDTSLEVAGQTIPAQQVEFHHHATDYRATLLVRDDGLVLRYPGLADLAFDERASAGRGRMPPLVTG